MVGSPFTLRIRLRISAHGQLIGAASGREIRHNGVEHREAFGADAQPAFAGIFDETVRDQLRVGLKAVTPADLAFINLVVQKVDQGVLPRKLVDSTFLWARNRYLTRPGSHRLRPIVYFQPALIARA